MLKASIFKAMSVLCMLGVVIGLATETALGMGYLLPKWSAQSMQAGYGIAGAIGLCIAGGIYLYLLSLAARHEAHIKSRMESM